MTPRTHLSIKKNILGAALFLLLLCSLVFSWVTYQQSTQAAQRTYDQLLSASALTIANAIQQDAGELQVEIPFAAMTLLPQNERLFFAVRHQNQVIAGYDDLAFALPLVHSTTPSFMTMPYKDTTVRVVSVGRFTTGSAASSGWTTIYVAETLSTRDALSTQLFLQGLRPLFLLVGVTFLLILFSIRYALSPLAQIEQAIEARSPTNLEPIRTPAPIEIHGLISTLNSFIQRLSKALTTQQHFVAEAAHQIRTPLALLQAQTEDALEENDPVQRELTLHAIHRHSQDLSQLVHQLLMHATITHRQDTTEHQRIRVPDLIRDSCQRLLEEQKSRLRIHITPPAQRLQIDGDQIALREMVRNLIENALLYSLEAVEIWVYVNYEKQVVIDIQDRGPGLSAEEKQQVTTRFFRGQSSANTIGSGLGMSIAAQVIAHHHGALHLRDRRSGSGLTVRVQLPAVATTPIQGGLGTGLIAAVLALGVVLPSHDTQATTHRYALDGATTPLRIAGPTDTAIFGSLAQAFIERHPQLAIHYTEIDTQELYHQVSTHQLTDIDLIISSATDLQVRLVNDGHAQAYHSDLTTALPDWAKWRNKIFGFTLEPIVLVYQTQLPDHYKAKTRAEFLQHIEDQPQFWRDRIGTYDIEHSGLGYLLAVFDERLSSNFWGMTNALGRVGAKLYTSTAGILDGVDSGELYAGYNVLGSYALAKQQAGAAIEVVIPDDYVLVFSRTAFIHKNSPQPHYAGLFIDYLLSDAGQQHIAQQAQLGSLIKNRDNSWPEEHLYESLIAPIQPIRIAPSLLAGLDRTRKKRFIQNWIRLITDTPP